MPLARVATAALVATLALVASAARAQSPDEARARQLFEQGVSAMDAGHPERAARYFNQSYSTLPRASTACNMALALERTGRSCDAESWYRQCAALDQSGRFRDHANRQAAALSSQCNQPRRAAHNPFVSGPSSGGGDGSQAGASSASGRVQVVEVGEGPSTPRDTGPGPSHALLGVGIAAALLGAGGIVGGWAATEESWRLADMLPESPNIPAGDPAEDTLNDAYTFRNLGLGLTIGGSVLAGLGAVLIVVDLAQPGVFGGQAGRGDGPRLALSPTPGGAFGRLSLSF